MTADIVRRDFQFLEGPVWVPGGLGSSQAVARGAAGPAPSSGFLLFSDIPASRIFRYSPATNSFDVFREPSNQANGNALDPQGRLVTCEHETRRVSRTEPDGTVVPLATHYEGNRLNSPNDVVCRSNGSVYFSDPPYGVEPERRELHFQGVFRVEPTPGPSKEGSEDFGTLTGGAEQQAHVVPVPLLRRGQGWVPPIQLLVRDFSKPNGLAFSPDENLLYIADTELGHIRAFDVKPNGSIKNSRVFCKVERPDGMRVDVEGNLYVCAMKAVEVVDREGNKIGEITLPERPANLAFGDTDRKMLYICARTSLYRVRVNIAGR